MELKEYIVFMDDSWVFTWQNYWAVIWQLNANNEYEKTDHGVRYVEDLLSDSVITKIETPAEILAMIEEAEGVSEKKLIFRQWVNEKIKELANEGVKFANHDAKGELLFGGEHIKLINGGEEYKDYNIYYVGVWDKDETYHTAIPKGCDLGNVRPAYITATGKKTFDFVDFVTPYDNIIKTGESND